ncbi:unnamed protein product [Brachionus calyciflorus]|uniref:Uncharacterized protein n=1 Tax=Brachionus calyciflorus TaxID=104777 RepID=A0A813QTD4_9BILA|nr:unnamed protein product [Brachionus calyciflorus]
MGTLFAQMTKQKPDNTYEINRKKAQLNEEEERFLNKFNRNETLKKLSSEPNSKTHSLKSTSNNESKFKEIDNWLESQNINSNISDFPDKDKQFKKNDLNTTKKLKLPIIMTTSADNLDKLEQNLVKTDQENDQKAKDSKSPAKLFVKKSRVSGRFSSQGDYKSKKSDVIKIKKSFENLHNDDSIETLKNRENLKAIDETYSNSFLTNQRKSINLESVEAGLL